MKQVSLVVLAVAGIFLSSVTSAQPGGKGVDRMYVLDCGQGHANDESRWTVGVNVGKPIDISVSCYLIHHADGYFLWDTGISDAVASMPDGWFPGNNPATDIHWTRAKTLESQLAAIGVKPSDIKFVGISHTHPDHIGNAELFASVPFLIQKAEYEYYFAPGKTGIAKPPSDAKPTFLKDHPVNLVLEDQDVFGDGSVMIVYTPGHTPGLGFVERGRRSPAGELGHSPHSLFWHHAVRAETPDAIVHAAHGGSDFLLSCAVVDQSRENSERQIETRAGLLRVGAM
jgi:N-acyl homoserine lactone hydrolase